MKASASVVIDQSIHTVWEFVANVENLEKWVDGVREPHWTSAGEIEVGSTFASKYAYRGKTFDMAYVVTEFSPPIRFATRSTSGPFPYQGVVDVEPGGDGTRVTNTIEVGSDSKATAVMFALFGPLLRIGMRRQLSKELKALASKV